MRTGQRNLGELVLAASDTFGDEVAFVIRRGFRIERITFRQAGSLARQVAAWLLSPAGGAAAPGDRVAIWAPNMPEYALLYFGVWLAGLVAVPIDVRTQPDVLNRFVAQSGARLGFKSRVVPGAFAPPVEKAVELDDLLDLVAGVQPLDTYPEAGRDTLCEIAFTSGTTGVPKGVMLSHGNFLAAVEALHVAFPLQRWYRALSLLPMSHAFEQVIGMLLTYTSGVRVRYVPRVNTVTIARTLLEERVTCLAVVPEMLRLLLSGMERRVQQAGKGWYWQAAHRVAPLLPFPLRRYVFWPVHAALGGHLQFFGCGGAALDVRVAQAWERMGIRIFEGYGLTETTAATTINNWRAQRLGSAGKPVPGVEVKIAPVPEDQQVEDGGDQGQGSAPPSGKGEILVRGPTVTAGYFDNPELTARAFSDGWFRTGDIGWFDDDGFLYIAAREAYKIVLPDGRNVYPEDVERVLNQYPAVKESCVVGIEPPGEPGRRRGVVVYAVLLTDAPDEAQAIVRQANRQLGAHQQIGGYTVWPEADFPRTATLKVDRKMVRAAVERLLRQRAGAPPAPLEPSPAPRESQATDPLTAAIAQVASRPVSEVRDEAELEADLGLDSLGRVELLAAIESERGQVVDEARVGPHTTVGDLRHLVAEAGISRPLRGASAATLRARWPRSWWARGLRRVLQWGLFRLQDRWLDFEIVHPERAAAIPLPSILIFNYQGPYAALAVLRALPPQIRQRVAIAADSRLWEGRDRWQGVLAEAAILAFPFAKSGGAVRRGLEQLGRWLDDGYAVIISPEGEPERDGELLPFLGGAGLMAVEMRVPVVPFRLEGYHLLFPSEPSFPYLPDKRGRARVIVGEPVRFPKGMSYQEATERARQALIATR